MGKNQEDRIYTLTVPTGGGKTISAFAWALEKARSCGKKHIIYVIPYTSIIEQTADILRSYLGEENVIEHHSQVEYEDTDEKMDTRRLATENWDAPVIVTTNVQFFESLFANRSSRCRKLHNMANSVLLFDEAQMFPVNYMTWCSGPGGPGPSFFLFSPFVQCHPAPAGTGSLHKAQS